MFRPAAIDTNESFSSRSTSPAPTAMRAPSTRAWSERSSFSSLLDDAAIWDVVALVRRLPSMALEGYQQLAQ
jgi:hypothetical protein